MGDTQDIGYVHVGKNVMPSGEWECALVLVVPMSEPGGMHRGS